MDSHWWGIDFHFIQADRNSIDGELMVQRIYVHLQIIQAIWGRWTFWATSNWTKFIATNRPRLAPKMVVSSRNSFKWPFIRVEEWYRWWTKSCTTKDDEYPIYRVLYIPGGAGFCPSTVVIQAQIQFTDSGTWKPGNRLTGQVCPHAVNPPHAGWFWERVRLSHQPSLFE